VRRRRSSCWGAGGHRVGERIWPGVPSKQIGERIMQIAQVGRGGVCAVRLGVSEFPMRSSSLTEIKQLGKYDSTARRHPWSVADDMAPFDDSGWRCRSSTCGAAGTRTVAGESVRRGHARTRSNAARCSDPQPEIVEIVVAVLSTLGSRIFPSVRPA